MNYSQALEYTHSLLKFGIKPGLDRISRLLSELGDPQKHLKYIHVAGTNGKGSVCAMLSSALIADKKKTGLFISPYIVDFCERIQINGTYISQDDFAKTAQRVKDAAEKLCLSPTEFEFITAVAFLYFKDNECDICVIETGLGGRLDSTNVIVPECSVITSISLDHTNILGDTVEEIAAEKCGIIKDRKNVITTALQPIEAMEVIIRHTAQHNSTLYTVYPDNVEDLRLDIRKTEFSYGDERYTVSLAGEFQVENALLAIQTLKLLSVPHSAICEGLSRTSHPARLQVICEDPLVILDGGHNRDGVLALKNCLLNFMPGEKMLGVCGMLADKDYTASLDTILPLFDEIIAVQPDNPRALPNHKLCEHILSKSIKCRTADVCDVKTLIEQNAQGRAVVIFGSLYLASEILSLYGYENKQYG